MALTMTQTEMRSLGAYGSTSQTLGVMQRAKIRTPGVPVFFYFANSSKLRQHLSRPAIEAQDLAKQAPEARADGEARDVHPTRHCEGKIWALLLLLFFFRSKKRHSKENKNIIQNYYSKWKIPERCENDQLRKYLSLPVLQIGLVDN